MPCIHGFNEINCPTCQIMKSSVPKNFLKIKERHANFSGAMHPFIKRNSKEKEDFIKELTSKRSNLIPNSINIIPRPSLLNDLPNFENKMFLERLKEIDIARVDKFGISKRIKLKNPEISIPKS